MTSLDIIQEIIDKNYNINTVIFNRFQKQKLLQNQIKFSDVEKEQFDKAMNIRNIYKLPFWDSMMLTYFNNKVTSDEILNCAIKHNSPIESIETTNVTLIVKILEENPNENIAFNSKVILKNNEIRHLPLLDFHIPVSDFNLIQIKKVLTFLGMKVGYILYSGESYHFIGNELLDEKSLVDFLSRSLFFSPIIDRAWIAHQLIERSCSLRVSKKHGIYPQLIYSLK